jgi:hypothetical protein
MATRIGVMYLHIATVRGSGYFPVDMLRYDQCWPSDSEAIEGIDFGIDRRVKRATEGSPVEPERCVRVSTLSQSKRPEQAFTAKRWASFGWTVVSVK